MRFCNDGLSGVQSAQGESKTACYLLLQLLLLLLLFSRPYPAWPTSIHSSLSSIQLLISYHFILPCTASHFFSFTQVKCDGRPNGCRNCERLQLDCVGDNGLAAGRATPMSLRKIRTYRSCKSCRLSKTKCNGDRPKCSRCTAKKTECVYDGGSAPRWARNLDRGSRTASTEGSRSKSRELAIAMLEASDEADAQDDTPMTSIGSAEPLKLGEISGSKKPLGSAQSVASIEPSGSDILSWYVPIWWHDLI